MKIERAKFIRLKDKFKFVKTLNPMMIMLIAVVILFAIVISYHLYKSYSMEEFLHEKSEEAVAVSTFKVHYENWVSELKSFGSLRAVLGIDLTSELGGIVQNVYFHDGQTIKKDDILVHLINDDDVALLKALEAEAKLAEVTYARDQAQYAINVVSKETLDMDLYTMQNAQELALQQAAIVKKKTITAPFDGKVGVSLIYPGVYLNPGDPIVSLQNLSSLYIDFYLPEKYISRIQKDQKVEFITDAYPKRIFTGKINAIEPEVDPDSRNIRIEGIIDNPQGELLPGMYVTVTVTSGEVEKKLTVPQTAITYNPYGNLVYVVTKKIKKNGKIEEEDFNEDSGDNDENKDQDEDNDNDSVDKNSDVDKDNDQDKDTSHKLYVEQKFVTLGELRGDQVVVLSGLKEGDEIVTSGQLKLKNHSQIVINNDVLPTNDANPDVKDEQKI